MSPLSHPRKAAERLFAQFLERREAGEPLAFDTWASGHPEVALELTRLHDRWQELVARLDQLAKPSADEAEGSAQ